MTPEDALKAIAALTADLPPNARLGALRKAIEEIEALTARGLGRAEPDPKEWETWSGKILDSGGWHSGNLG